MSKEHLKYWKDVGELVKEIFMSTDECICDVLQELNESGDEKEYDGRYSQPCHYCQTMDVIQDTLSSYYNKEIKRVDVVEILREYNIQNLEIVEAIEAVDQLKKE